MGAEGERKSFFFRWLWLNKWKMALNLIKIIRRCQNAKRSQLATERKRAFSNEGTRASNGGKKCFTFCSVGGVP